MSKVRSIVNYFASKIAGPNKIPVTESGGRLTSGFLPSSTEVVSAGIYGFDRNDLNTLGECTYNEPTRTFSIAPKTGQSSFHFWAGGTKYIKTTAQSVVWDDTTGTYYFYFDSDGALQTVVNSGLTSDIFYRATICGMCYYNKEENTVWCAEDEMHSIYMDSYTHLRLHICDQFKHGQGCLITGLADASDDYTSVSSGNHFDEDIIITSSETTTHYFMYRSGTEGGWKLSPSADNKIAYMGPSYAYWNEYTGGAWQLTESDNASDYIIYYMLKTNLAGNPGLVKIVGQQTYASRAEARTALLSNLKTIYLAGLSSSEAEFQYAWIAKRDGTLEDDGNGNAYYDLRGIKIQALTV